MAGISRRTVLYGASTAAGVAAVGGVGFARPAAAGSTAAARQTHEAVVRDARMVWHRLPTGPGDAPYLGTGSAGAHVERGAHGNELDVVLFPAASGRVVLRFAGTVTAVDLTLDPWDAELSGVVTTTRGSVGLTALAHAVLGVLVVDLVPSAGEAAVAWSVPADRPWRETRTGARRRCVIALADTGTAVDGADLGAGLVTTHREHWHAFYRRGLVSVPDKRAQRLYLVQLYAAASLGVTAPAGAAHPMLLRAGHLPAAGGPAAPLPVSTVGGFGIPGTGGRSAQSDNPVAAWGLPERWLAYRLSTDPHVLRDDLYPALTRALTFYRPFLHDGADGYLHLPVTHSPTYADVADCTYDLALLRWAAARAADCAGLLGRPAAEVAGWADLRDRLVPYHRDDSGVLIGAGLPLGDSHPHPSHLLWLHPLSGTGGTGGRRSLAHWAARPESWQAPSFAAAASMSAALGAADEAGRHLAGALAGLSPNGRHADGDAAALSVGGAVLDMLVRGDDGVLDVFPAAGDHWRDASISGLRVAGGFVLDAARRDGRTTWIRLRGDAGGTMTVRHGIGAEVDVRASGGHAVTGAPGEIVLRLPPGGDVVLSRAGAPPPDLEPYDVPAAGSAGPWGLPTSAQE